MFLTVPRGLTKRVSISLITVLLLGIAYFRFYIGYEHWYMSSGDRVLSNIKFCTPLPKSSEVFTKSVTNVLLCG